MTPASGTAAPAQADERARAAAEAVAVGRLLNIYVRESGGEGLRVAGAAEPAPPAVAAVARALGEPERSDLAWVRLPCTGAVLVAPLAVRSTVGHHRLAGPVFEVRPAAGPGPAPDATARDVPAAPTTPTGAGPAAPTTPAGAGPAAPTPAGAGPAAPTPAGAGQAAHTTPADAGPVGVASEVGSQAGGDTGEGGRPVRVASAAALAATIAAELLAASDEGPASGGVAGVVDTLRREVASSVARSARYVGERLAGDGRPDPVDAVDPTMAAEASLAFGHPFHPAPKLADGFDADDVATFTPELSPGFPLWWIAAPPELIADDHLPAAGRLPIPPEVDHAARRLLTGWRAAWHLVPCHPWQARALAARADLAGPLADGSVRLVGPLGPEVQPTSSVRTVRWPDGSFWKLSLDVRITNFVRHNTAEQVRRTLDAGRIVTALPPRLRSGRLEILADTAYRALALPGAPELTTATAVLHRPAPAAAADTAAGRAGTVPPMVVAGLVEPDPRTGAPPIRRLLAAAAAVTDVPLDRIGRRWLRAYLRISLRPLLRLLLDQGISLEAHTQNSLAGFTDGWPARLVVRDLEGTSVDGTHPLAAAHRRLLGTGGSPVLYSPDEAWQRFAYYVVVNHIGQVVATVATEAGVPEDELWAEVAALARAEAEAAEGPPADHLRRALLGPTLPAKANLTSRLLGRSERPVYVDIPNPCR